MTKRRPSSRKPTPRKASKVAPRKPAKPPKQGRAKASRTARTQDSGEARLWSIIDRVKRVGAGDLERSIASFREQLSSLDDAELVHVEAAFCRAMQRAYDYDLWGAAYVIHGGCSDDTFWDFRAGLIALGRKVFEDAVREPETLVRIKDVENRTLFEGFQYVPTQLLEERRLTSIGGSHGMDRKPTGTRWNADDELAARFPKLTKRFD